LTCAVTINSSSAGTFTVNVTGSVTEGGVTVTRATGDGAHGDSGNGVKNFVDAKIAINPLAPVNEVGNAETFTVTFTAIPAGTGTPSFASPLTVKVTPTGATESDTCFSGTGGWTVTGNVLTCTVTINSSTAGTFTVNVTGSVTEGGVKVTRSTGDGLTGDSANAVKNFVDAKIAITPLAPVNEVGNAETFNVTFTAIPANTGTPTFT